MLYIHVWGKMTTGIFVVTVLSVGLFIIMMVHLNAIVNVLTVFFVLYTFISNCFQLQWEIMNRIFGSHRIRKIKAQLILSHRFLMTKSYQLYA